MAEQRAGLRCGASIRHQGQSSADYSPGIMDLGVEPDIKNAFLNTAP